MDYEFQYLWRKILDYIMMSRTRCDSLKRGGIGWMITIYTYLGGVKFWND